MNYNAGAQTVVSNVIMASAVLVTLLFLMPLFSYTPSFILAAIIITAVIGLIDYQAAMRLWKVDKLDFVACLCSFLGVLFISVPLGLAIAVSFSFPSTRLSDALVPRPFHFKKIPLLLQFPKFRNCS